MRESWIILAVVTMALGLSAIVQAANGATVTKATLASGFCDTTGCYAATCNETQVVNENQRKETFDCTFDAARPAPFVCDTSVGCGWFSDFDGARQVTRTSSSLRSAPWWAGRRTSDGSDAGAVT